MEREKKILYAVTPPERGAPANHADFLFFCPGCKCAHGVWTTKKNTLNAIWTFNGNMEKPTFTPSLSITWVENPPVDPATDDFPRGPDGQYLLGPDGRLLGAKDRVCHTVVTDGVINFCGDCTHELAGKSVPMEAF